jgi:hypothetical protein
MKNILTLAFLLLCLQFQSWGQDAQYATTVDILSNTDEQKIKGAQDLTVTREGEKYAFEFYIKHGKKVQMHRAYLVTDKVFTKAGFFWVSDKKVAIKLFNDNSIEVFKLMLWGEKGATGMQVESEDFISK